MLEALLEIADSSMTYRRRYLSSSQAAPVLDLLLADETNPRSLAFQLAALAESIDRLPRDPTRPGRSAEQRLVLADLTEVRLAELDALASADERAAGPARAACSPARGRPPGPLRRRSPPATSATCRPRGTWPVRGRRHGDERGRRAMTLQVIHTTIYDYIEPVSLCHNVSHLTARNWPLADAGGRATCGSARPRR